MVQLDRDIQSLLGFIGYMVLYYMGTQKLVRT